ncbi:MAG: substrate-binding domain-containing protein [Clostridiales bacterium]|nr:substrate-binding domain-containing protein [Clostridiales bacterium]
MILQGAEQIGNYGKNLSEITGSLKLAIPDSILIYNIQPFIRAFKHEAPNIQLVINSIQADDINQAIVDGSADIGKRYHPRTVYESTEYRSRQKIFLNDFLFS